MKLSAASGLEIYIAAPDREHVILRKAESELREYFRRIFGETEQTQAETAVEFVVEPTEQLQYDGFAVEILPDRIRISSAMERGILYGVYRLLRLLGCRFIFPRKEFEIVPRHQTYHLKTGKYVYNPLLEYRGLCLYNTTPQTLEETLQTIDFMGKNNYNLLLTSIDRKDDTAANCHAIEYAKIQSNILPQLQQRGIEIDMSEHSTDYFFPREKYFREHPEWFSLRDGKRVPGQICYSNDEAVEVYTQAFVAFVEKHPEIRFLGTWPLDGGGYCECEKCRDPLLLYKTAVRIAQAVHKVRPDVVVEHLAYTPQSFTCPPEPLAPGMSVLVCSVKDQIAYNWGRCAQQSGGAFYFDYCTGDHYRYRADLFINPFYINTMVNNFATYRYRGIISLFLPITAWWQAGINYSLLAESYYDPMEPVEQRIEELCRGIFGESNGIIIARAMYMAVSRLQSKLLWSGHPHKHTYMPQHTDWRTEHVDQMHLKAFRRTYEDIAQILQQVKEEQFTPQQKKQFAYFKAYLQLQRIYFEDIDQFDACTQTEQQAERYLQTLKVLEETLGPVFISEEYARWRIVGRDNILRPSAQAAAYQPQT